MQASRIAAITADFNIGDAFRLLQEVKDEPFERFLAYFRDWRQSQRGVASGMELPLKIVWLRDLSPGMRVQLKAGEPESAEIARVDGNEVHFTNGSAMTLEPRKKVAIFNPEYVPRPEPVNDIPTFKWPEPKHSWWRR